MSNEIENSEQKLTDSAKSVDWSGDIDKTNKGNCQFSFSSTSFFLLQRLKKTLFEIERILTGTADLIRN